nr:PREDICTED: uncharacterized protein LOC105667701 [Linepithema humile]
MKIIVRFLPLILCATLTLAVNNLIQSEDIGSSIRIAHCRSICQMTYIVDGVKCTNDTEINYCLQCWRQCAMFGIMEEENRHAVCSAFKKHKAIPNYAGIHTACVFYETRGAEKDKYEPSKLPAPEKCKTIHMKDHDVAVIMRKNIKGRWLTDNYYSANEISTLPEGAWIIVASEDGTLRHYSWEMWKPTLESLKVGDPLYQAHITWKDWHAQLEHQLQKAYPELKHKTGFYPWKKKPSFVVTWQYETGDGIMGNQVTDSESAHISLPSNSKYLVRITTDDSPGSYPIVVNTRSRFRNILLWKPIEQFCSIWWFVMFPAIITLHIIIFYILNVLYRRLSSKPNRLVNNLEEGRLPKRKEKDIEVTKKKNCDKLTKNEGKFARHKRELARQESKLVKRKRDSAAV